MLDAQGQELLVRDGSHVSGDETDEIGVMVVFVWVEASWLVVKRVWVERKKFRELAWPESSSEVLRA